jgi:hypothetical protein
MGHTVRLPYPDRREPTVGTCRCGWTVVYGWGQHGDAVQAAGDHIEAQELAEPVETAQMNGDRMIFPGRSL